MSVKIPRIDRGGVDFPHLAKMVLKVSRHGEKFFGILTVYGTLNDNLIVEYLEPYVGVVTVNPGDYGKKMVSLREAAQMQAARTSSIWVVNTICNCKGVCTNDGRCK